MILRLILEYIVYSFVDRPPEPSPFPSLDAIKIEFMTKCADALEESGFYAKGTDSFTVLFGENFEHELILDDYYDQYMSTGNESHGVAAAVKAAQEMAR